MPTPGAAPRGRMAREPQEACRGPTARAAPDARRGHPGAPRRVRRRPRGGPGRPRRWTLTPSRRAPRSTATSGCCWPGPTAINLTAIREPAAVAVGSRRRQPDGRRRPPRARRRPVHRPRVGRRLPGPPARGGAARGPRRCSLEPVAKKAGFLSRRGRGDGPGPTRSRRRAVRAEALAADGRHRGRWPAVTARAVASLADLVELALPAARAGRLPRRLEARRPRPRSWLPRTGRSPPSAAARSRSVHVAVPGLDGPSAGRRHGARPRPGRRTRATRPRASARPW